MTLDLVVTGHWYDEIVAGRKWCEYRVTSEWWMKRIWKRRRQLTHVRFRRGYTTIGSTYRISKIDMGPCPYPNWNKRYIRIYFQPMEGES